jgi:hypothetical protein
MSSGARLIEPVLAAPHDMAPRRAYADAIRATEPDRAALIDHQLALREAHRSGTAPADRDASAARDLIRRFGDRWCGPIASAVDTYTYWGGFIEEVRVTADRFSEAAPVLRGFAPVRMLTLTKLRGHLPAVLAEPLLAQLVALDVGENGLTDDDVAAIAATPALRGLAVLRIAGNVDCGYPALRALAALPALRFVDADDTKTPLRIRSADWEGGSTEVNYTAAQERLEHELGKRPWLDALERPSNHAL